MKYYWFNKKCCVPECHNSSTEGEGCYKEFFNLPAEPTARARWLNAVLSVDGENLKICEDHFKEDDIFRDKNHRKKLRLNSVPSVKLPQNICTTCLGTIRPPQHSDDFGLKKCQCASKNVVPTTIALPQISPEKRVRVTWSSEEKRTLFKAIRKHGDVKFVNNSFRINWDSVLNNCRNYGCFGNEKELKSAWQYIRQRAVKVYRNEIYGTKLERKVSRFLYGKGPKMNRLRPASAGINLNNSVQQSVNMETCTSDDEFEERLPADIPQDEQEESAVTQNESELPSTHKGNEELLNDSYNNNDEKYLDEMQCDEANENEVLNRESMTTENDSCSESDDEYYSIEDVKTKLGININAEEPTVISLISSDESEPE